MAGLCRNSCGPLIIALLTILACFDQPSQADPGRSGVSLLYNHPILISDPGMHVGQITATATDAKGVLYVTASFDKSLRVWDAATGILKRTIWVPAGPDVNGKLYTVSITPDGSLIAAGGQTWGDGQSSIFVFDSQSGALHKRIPLGPRIIDAEKDGANVLSTSFSRDGRYLAVGLGEQGLRVFDSSRDWAEVFKDEAFTASIYAMDFAADGRMVAASFDGLVKLYSAAFTELRLGWAPHNEDPDNIRFSPDGLDIAISYRNKSAVDFLDAATLAISHNGLSDKDLGGKGVSRIAWSNDSNELAIGTNHGLYRWSRFFGASRSFALLTYRGPLIDLHSIPSGLIITTAEPVIADVADNDELRWQKTSPFINFRPQRSTFSISNDANLVDFDLGKDRLRFNVRALTLTKAAPDGSTSPAKNETAAWLTDPSGRRQLVAGGIALQVHPSDVIFSAADGPDHDRYVLGTAFFLEALSVRQHLELWHRSVQSEVYATNVSSDNRLIVAALGDGTIRWYRTSDGQELLAFYILEDRNWVIWTPEGFYASTSHAHGVLKWLIERGAERSADTYLVSRLHQLDRPDAIKYVLQTLDTAQAIGRADQDLSRQAVQQLTGSDVVTSSHLYVLSIGLSEYGLLSFGMHTTYGRADAELFTKSILSSQAERGSGPGDLYSDVTSYLLYNEQATKKKIEDVLTEIEAHVSASGNDNNVLMILFSGHGGRLSDGNYVLPTYDTITINDDFMRRSALSIDELNQEIGRIARHSHVALFIDACHSGAVADISGLRALAQAKVNVFASSSTSELSSEQPDWGHGALTKAVLDALSPAADLDHNGLISSTELASYITEQIPLLTNRTQSPTIELRYQSDFLAIGTP